MELSNKWKQLTNQRFLWLFIFNTLFFILAAYLLPSRYETNDDVIMMLIASGKYSGAPEAHLVFINYVYGLFLKLLYSWNNQIEWYSFLFALLHVISISVIGWHMLVIAKARLIFKILLLLIFYSLELRFIMLFQFTTTSALCAISGLILIAEGKKYQNYFGVSLFVIAGLIRLEAASLVLLIVLPIFLKFILLNGKLLYSRSLGFLITALFLIGLMKFIDYKAYNNSKWSYYEKYNNVRGKINDNPFIWETKRPSNVTSYDYMLLLNFFADVHTLDLDKLLTIKKGFANVGIKTKIANFLPSLRDFKSVLIIILVTSLIFLLYNKDKKSRLIFFLSLCLFFFALFYVSSFGTVKSRVFLSAVMALFFVMFFTVQDNKTAAIYTKTSLLISFSLFILLFFRHTVVYWNIDRNYRELQLSAQHQLLNKYLQNREHSVIPFSSSYAMEYNSPFREYYFKNGQLFFLGWLTNNPLNQSIFDSYLDLIDRHAIFFEKSIFEKIIPLLEESILHNYGIRVLPETVMECENYIIVKLKRISSY